jgi:hypothetical protein
MRGLKNENTDIPMISNVKCFVCDYMHLHITYHLSSIRGIVETLWKHLSLKALSVPLPFPPKPIAQWGFSPNLLGQRARDID